MTDDTLTPAYLDGIEAEAREAVFLTALGFDDQNYYAKWEGEMGIDLDRYGAFRSARGAWEEHSCFERCAGIGPCASEATLIACIREIESHDA